MCFSVKGLRACGCEDFECCPHTGSAIGPNPRAQIKESMLTWRFMGSYK